MSSARRRVAALLMAALMLPYAAMPADLPSFLKSGSAWWEHRMYPNVLKVRDVKGVQDRIVNSKLSLTLKSFLELVLMNSTDINVVRLDVYSASSNILAARAPYDPFASASFSANRSVQPSSSQISGATTLSNLNQNSALNFQQLLPTGQNVNASLNATRSSNNSAFSLLNPSILGTFNFSVAQPLLQDRSRIQVRGPMQIARSQLTITSRQSEARIADLVATAASAYWTAVQARDNVKVLQQTLDLAQKSYDRDKQALDLGALAQLDIFQSEAQVAGRKRDLVQANYLYKADVDALRRLMGADL